MPRPGDTLRETAVVGGWSVGESGRKRVTIFLDAQFIGFAPVEGKRSDAKLYYKNFPGAETLGWTGC